MSEELGKIEKPLAEEFKKGRRLYLVPLIYCEKEPPAEYLVKFNKYWNQVEDQVSSLELKLGRIDRIYHELVPVGGDDGVKTIRDLHDKSCQVIENRLAKGAEMEATEEAELLTEFMDWSRCLVTGLQNEKVFARVYKYYAKASKKRNEHIARHIAETLKPDEVGILFMREGHRIQFCSDIKVFYIAPPALDEIKRWLRQRKVEPPSEE
jgi:hypothetical protein